MAKFEEFFKEPQEFSNQTYVISGELSREEAALKISMFLEREGHSDEPLSPDNLIKDRVKFGFAPEHVVDLQGELCWYSGANGRGSKEVWVYEF